MKISFKNEKLRKICEEEKVAQKKLGKHRASLLQVRLFELDARKNVEGKEGLRFGDPHELKGNRKGEYSVDLDKGSRVLFVPDGAIPKKNDGGMTWDGVIKIKII